MRRLYIVLILASLQSPSSHKPFTTHNNQSTSNHCVLQRRRPRAIARVLKRRPSMSKRRPSTRGVKAKRSPSMRNVSSLIKLARVMLKVRMIRIVLV